MRATLLLSAAAVLSLSAATARGADLIVDAAPPVVASATGFDWSGAYVGAHIGYGAGTIYYHSPDAPVNDYEEDVDGFLAGAQIGYNWQFDQIVVGLQSDFAYNSSETADGDSIRWIGTTTGRLGVALDSLLVYGKAGLAYGLSDVSMTWGPDTEEGSDWHVGWTAGIGAEVAVTEEISIFAEYDYVDLGAATYFALFGPVGPNGTEISFTSHIVKAGVNFSF